MSELPYWSPVEKEGYVGAETRWVEFGEGARAFLAIPESGTPPYRAIIVGHERYGLVLDSFDVAARFAAYGYVAIAPDMAAKFTGDKDALNRGDIGGGWNDEIVRSYMAQSYDFLTTLSEVDPGAISAIGFCASGGWAWLLNSVRPDLVACICYYGGGRYDEELMSKVTAPTLFVYGEKDHTTPVDRVFAFRDEMERRNQTCEVRLVADMPHGWMNDTMKGRYRQQEAEEAWDQIMDFLDRAHGGYFKADQVHLGFEADFAADYDFRTSVRYGEGAFPEPSMTRFAELRERVAAGQAPRSELDAFIALYPEFFALHPEMAGR